jgi:hypothetical protein
MKSKRSLAQIFVISAAAIVVTMCCFVSTGSQQAFADLGCSNTVSGSTQQGAICLPSDPTGVTSKIPDTTGNGILLQVINAMAGVAALIAIIFVIIGGYRYIFSAGNDETAEAGRKTVVNALIGLVVIVLSYTIVVVLIRTINNPTTTSTTSTSTSTGGGTSTPAAPGGVTTSIICSNGAVVTYAAECDQVITK